MPEQNLQILWERLLDEQREGVAAYLETVAAGCDQAALRRARLMLADVARGVESVRRVIFPGTTP